jgi:hypothetical protein
MSAIIEAKDEISYMGPETMNKRMRRRRAKKNTKKLQ